MKGTPNGVPFFLYFFQEKDCENKADCFRKKWCPPNAFPTKEKSQHKQCPCNGNDTSDEGKQCGFCGSFDGCKVTGNDDIETGNQK